MVPNRDTVFTSASKSSFRISAMCDQLMCFSGMFVKSHALTFFWAKQASPAALGDPLSSTTCRRSVAWPAMAASTRCPSSLTGTATSTGISVGRKLSRLLRLASKTPGQPELLSLECQPRPRPRPRPSGTGLLRLLLRLAGRTPGLRLAGRTPGHRLAGRSPGLRLASRTPGHPELLSLSLLSLGFSGLFRLALRLAGMTLRQPDHLSLA